MMSENLADYLQIWGIEDEFIAFTDGSVGFGMNLRPIDVSCWSDDSINELSQRTAHFLNGLPENLSLQFVQDICPGNDAIISEHQTLGANSSELTQALTTTRVSKLQKLDQNQQLPVHGLKLFVRKPRTSPGLQKTKIWQKKSKFEEITEHEFQRELTSSSKLREEIAEKLRSLGLHSENITGEDVVRLIYAQWNPTRPVDIQGFDPENLRSSLLFSDVSINSSGFTVGEMHHRVISLKVLPDQSHSSMAAVLRGLPFGSRLFLTVNIPNQLKEMESLQTQRRIAYSMAVGKKTGVSDLESGAKFADLERLLEQMISQGERVFHVGLNVVLSSRDKDELESYVAQTLSVIREMGGAEAMEETLAAFELFSQVSVPNARVKERMKRIKTSNLCDLLPVYGPWPGHKSPRVLLRSRLGSLLCLDPFDSSLTNANQLVSGASGAGKSFLTNVLILQMLKENPRVFFVDIGGSYKKLCENLGGQYINLALDSGISINPFDLAEGESEPSSHKLKFLLGLIELMTKEDDQSRLPRLERSELEQRIISIYKKVPKPTLSHLRDSLLSDPNSPVYRLGQILSTWCGDTPFGRLIDRPSTVQLDRQIVAFDLKGMENYPELQAACLYIITDLVWREVQRDRKTMKFLVFDECWKLLKSESGLSFIEEVFRTFRKYFASAIAISQDIDDFAKSSIAGAILPNCSMKWVLLQPQGDRTRLKEVLSLNDNEVELVNSIQQKKGVFSEVFLMAGENRTLAVVESTSLELWIATTDPRDLAMIESYRTQHPEKSHSEILKDLSELYPNGVAGSQSK